MQGLKLIVHADDFGLSREINEGILEAHRRGILTSTSLVASGQAFAHAVDLARASPTLDLGIHLTLTEERPVLSPDEVPTLVNDRGHFHSNVGAFVKRYFTRQISLDDVHRELNAQIMRVKSQGLPITHLDGHQHVHMVRGIRRIIEVLAREHQVSAVRFPRERLSGYMLIDPRSWRRVMELLALNAFCAAAGRSAARRTDRFIGFYYGGQLTKENLVEVLKRLPRIGTCELMCHPGLHHTDSPYAHWNYHWQQELDALTAPEIREDLEARGVELISYADLPSA